MLTNADIAIVFIFLKIHLSQQTMQMIPRLRSITPFYPYIYNQLRHTSQTYRQPWTSFPSTAPGYQQPRL